MIGLARSYDRFPYVPSDPATRDVRCAEIYEIQVQGLVKRMQAMQARSLVIERLMCDHRVDVGMVCESFGTEPSGLLRSAYLDELVAEGLVERTGTSIAVKPHARPLVRSIAAAFDAHLSSGGRHSRAV